MITILNREEVYLLFLPTSINFQICEKFYWPENQLLVKKAPKPEKCKKKKKKWPAADQEDIDDCDQDHTQEGQTNGPVDHLQDWPEIDLDIEPEPVHLEKMQEKETDIHDTGHQLPIAKRK